MAEFESGILDDTAQRAARLVALALLSELDAERRRLGSAHDSEALHDFRVALRRLRTWLRALAPVLEGSVPESSLRRLRRIARESNVGRDAEVFLNWLASSRAELSHREHAAIRFLEERFQTQQREADNGLGDRLARDFERVRTRLETRLSTYKVQAHVFSGLREPSFAPTMASLLLQQGEELRRRLRRVHSVDDIREVHQARIAGKRLRYLLEPVAAHTGLGAVLIERLKGLQDNLGDLHDAHAWLMVLRDVVAELAMDEGRRMARAFAPTAAATPDAGRRRGPARGGFVSLARLAQERSAGAFDAFGVNWNEKTARRFFRDLARLARELRARSPGVLEIERKFLLTGMPPLPESTTLTMHQGYIPGERLVERLRMVQEGRHRRYYRTIKVGSGLVRTELEEETSRAVFEQMWPLTEGKRLTKRRHVVPDGDLHWEIDEFTDRQLVLAEVELPSADVVVELPEWLAPCVDRDVTGDPAYLNSTLAR